MSKTLQNVEENAKAKENANNNTEELSVLLFEDKSINISLKTSAAFEVYKKIVNDIHFKQKKLFSEIENFYEERMET